MLRFMSQFGMSDFLDDESTPVAIANATSAGVAGWTGQFSRGQGFWDFELIATDDPEIRLHGVVTDRSQLAIVCIHRRDGGRVVAVEPPDPPENVEDEGGYAAWMAGVLAHAVDAPDDARPVAAPPPMSLLPGGDHWDAWFVIQPTLHEFYPKADMSRSFLAEGAAALAARDPDSPIEFWFDVPYPAELGVDPDEASCPWLFEAWPNGAEARVRLSFWEGLMGPDEVYGWAAWTDDVVWFAAYDAATGGCTIAKVAKPVELRERGSDDPAWWLALARLLVLLDAQVVGDPLYLGY